MGNKADIPATLKRLFLLVSQMGYECEMLDENELFVFTATLPDAGKEDITISINVTANGRNEHIGEGNYIAFEVFIPCGLLTETEELQISYYIMKLMEEVDLIAIQYVPSIHQVLISRVDCIREDLPDDFITDYIIKPMVNEFLHVFSVIEFSPEDDEISDTILPQVKSQYLN